jgi:hypothetical protein
MVSGLPPFDGADDREILLKIQTISYTFDCKFFYKNRSINEKNIWITKRFNK